MHIDTQQASLTALAGQHSALPHLQEDVQKLRTLREIVLKRIGERHAAVSRQEKIRKRDQEIDVNLDFHFRRPSISQQVIYQHKKKLNDKEILNGPEEVNFNDLASYCSTTTPSVSASLVPKSSLSRSRSRSRSRSSPSRKVSISLPPPRSRSPESLYYVNSRYIPYEPYPLSPPRNISRSIRRRHSRSPRSPINDNPRYYPYDPYQAPPPPPPPPPPHAYQDPLYYEPESPYREYYTSLSYSRHDSPPPLPLPPHESYDIYGSVPGYRSPPGDFRSDYNHIRYSEFDERRGYGELNYGDYYDSYPQVNHPLVSPMAQSPGLPSSRAFPPPRLRSPPPLSPGDYGYRQYDGRYRNGFIPMNRYPDDY